MNKKVLGIFLILLLIPSTIFALQATVSYYDPIPAKAGSFVDVWIRITNNDNSETRNTIVRIIPKDSLQLAEGEESDKNIGTIQRGGNGFAKVRLKVVENAVKGPNRIELQIMPQNKGVQKEIVHIEVKNDTPNLEIGSATSSPLKIYPDTEDIQLDLTVLNIGNATAKNVRAKLMLPNGFEASKSYSNIALIGNIANDASSIATFFIDAKKELKSGIYTGKLEVNYTKSDSTDPKYETKILTFDLPVKKKPFFDIVEARTDPAELSGGDKDATLILKVKNVGEKKGESIRVKVFEKTEQPFKFKTNSSFVASELAPNESGETTIIFNVKPEAKTIDYIIELEIRYLTDDDVFVESKTLKLPVKSEAKKQPGFEILIYATGGLIFVVILFFGAKKFLIGKKKKGKK